MEKSYQSLFDVTVSAAMGLTVFQQSSCKILSEAFAK